MTADAVFERSDKNKDGKLTKDELPDFFWQRLSAADADKDGSVSKAELEEHFKNMRPPGTRPNEEKPATP